MNFINEYLKKINSEMQKLLSKYEVVEYTSEKDIELGLLRFNKPPVGKAFLFIFPNEEVKEFHTIGMKFPIKIYFFNKDEKLVYSCNAKPGIKIISSKLPTMYVVEIP
jgi:uncharacterized membrane protein (UPF0127 family)